MPRAETKLVLEAGIDEVMEVIGDSKKIAECLPFVEKLIDEKTWGIKDQQAKITKTKTLKLESFEKRANQVSWKASGENLTTALEARVKKADEGTIINATLTMEVSGILGKVLTPIVKTNLESQLKGYLNKVKKQLESSPTKKD